MKERTLINRYHQTQERPKPPVEEGVKVIDTLDKKMSDEATEHIERHLWLKMALVHQNSCDCTKSELDLFGVPPTQTSVEHGYWEQKGLTSTLTDQGPYEFAVSGAGDDYIDLFPNSHVPHWSESVVLQTNPIPISYIRKSFGVLEPFLTEDVFRCVP
jgi:hypothetical protein